MCIRRSHRLLWAFLIYTFPRILCAQPTISGDLAGTLGPGDFVVVGDCNVSAGQTLTIMPGTTFLFSGHYCLEVFGQLSADGTETDSIRFIRQFPTEECKHGGLRIQPGASMNNTLSYCRIDYAENPDFPNCWGGGVLSDGAGLTIDCCLITNCRALFGGGVYVSNSDCVVSNSTIAGCSAIDKGGALFASFSSLSISNCIFTHNTADDAAGIYIYTNGEATVENCIVSFNSSMSTAG